MAQRTNKTFICSVVFLDIVEYSKKPVEEQIKSKNLFNSLLSNAIRDIAINDRIILDTGDGAAIGFLGDPEDALFVAMTLCEGAAKSQQTSSPQFSIRIGINLGPIKLVKDINGQDNLIGDGINLAQRVMSFAEPGQLMVSRSYYDVISCLSQEYAQLFHYQGLRSDKHIREHAVYSVEYFGKNNIGTTDGQNIIESSGKDAVGQQSLPYAERLAAIRKIRASSQTLPQPTIHRWNNKELLYGAVPLAVITILIFLFVLRSSKVSEVNRKTVTPSITNEQLKPQPTVTTPAPDKASSVPASQPVLIRLGITPWGEVHVDGKKQGVSPPLSVLHVTPGKHKIEIKNTTFATYTKTIDLKPGSSVKIKHKFQ
jgi:hypothetical protein